VALALRRLGVIRVRPLAGGLAAWHEHGFPVTPIEAEAKAPGS